MEADFSSPLSSLVLCAHCVLPYTAGAMVQLVYAVAGALVGVLRLIGVGQVESGWLVLGW